MANNIFQKFVFLLVIAITLQLTYCKRKKSIEGFNSEKWVEDQNGCDSVRAEMMQDFLKVKFKLRGMKTTEIEEILGKPDGIELYKRDQKYYIYYMEPGADCSNSLENPLKLFVRFSAVGIANEFTIKSED